MKYCGVEFGIIIPAFMINESTVVSSEFGSKSSIEVYIHSFAVFVQQIILSSVDIVAE